MQSVIVGVAKRKPAISLLSVFDFLEMAGQARHDSL